MTKEELFSLLLLFHSKTPAVMAAVTYVRRRDGDEYPQGTINSSGMWIPDESEKFDFSLPRANPRGGTDALRKLCCTAKHCAQRVGAELRTTRRIANRIDRATRMTNEDAYPAGWLVEEVNKILTQEVQETTSQES